MEDQDLRRQDAMTHLVESHRGYAHAIASELLKKLPRSVDRADVEGAAELGLVEAARAYDPSRGVSFATFAYYRVRGAIYDDLRLVSRASKFEEAANAYMADYSSACIQPKRLEGEYREIKMIASHVGTSYVLSLDSLTRGPEDRSIEAPVDRMIRKESHKRVREALAQLPEKNRRVIEAYYFEDRSFGQIARELGTSESSAWRLHAKSLEMIRSLLDQPIGRRGKTASLATRRSAARRTASLDTWPR
jgi:RNA polymerase sigma factor for flagellar operon FliA